ncbi:glycosyltransferase family 9 protein [Usitatibacter palustris]|uniref:Lipopolysaccharide core heptosyltransferase RfaQ n=1 Tax=Usitatibacter palustris TaxID=2732487 RepID=A0A6M4HBE1_9PROT|nr:glycosyltransferase family 9 protein [Usitatibacter palustris]QJR16916.1 Lipopolysaccharide core heptosyltransferase RfaQ [Usitatibacter palustris]
MKILVVRRDNIGDLVLTTPVFAALRAHFPEARIDAFVNSYNAPVLAGHPHVDRVHSYTKGKHRDEGGAISGAWSRLRQLMSLRGEHYDHVLVATPGYRPREIQFARWLAPAHIAAFVAPGQNVAGVDEPVEFVPNVGRHQVEETFRILTPLGIYDAPPALHIAAKRERRAGPATIAVHVSARKASSRWPEERFAPLMRALHERFAAKLRLFWSPGTEDDPRHPGDDQKARRILEAAKGIPVEPCETRELGELIAGLAQCDAMVCSDGGAMHLAAALGLPVVCFFGESDAASWRPWGVPYRVLQPASRNVRDVTLEETLRACEEIFSPTISPART